MYEFHEDTPPETEGDKDANALAVMVFAVGFAVGLLALIGAITVWRWLFL